MADTKPVARVLVTGDGFTAVDADTEIVIATSGTRETLEQELTANGYDLEPVAAPNKANSTVPKGK